MGEEQGLSAENRALVERAFPTWTARDVEAAYLAVPGKALNRLLNAARAEGLQPPVGVEEEELGSVGSGLTPLVPSPSASGLVAQPSDADFLADFLSASPGPGNPECDDPECGYYPQYGVAPHECFYKRGPEFGIGQSVMLPRAKWPANFVLDLEPGEDPETVAYPSACGVYYCPTCLHGMPSEGVAIKSAADGEASKPKARATEPKPVSPTNRQTSGGEA